MRGKDLTYLLIHLLIDPYKFITSICYNIKDDVLALSKLCFKPHSSTIFSIPFVYVRVLCSLAECRLRAEVNYSQLLASSSAFVCAVYKKEEE